MDYFSEEEILMLEQVATKADNYIFGKGAIDDVPKRHIMFKVLIGCQDVINEIRVIHSLGKKKDHG